MEELAALGTVAARSPIMASPPMGPAQRRFANSVCVLESEYDPPALLRALKRMEGQFGRRPGRRWGDRVLDLDIILWSGGIWSDSELSVPHSEFRQRDFVLRPAKTIVPHWRDPVTALTIAQLDARCP